MKQIIATIYISISLIMLFSIFLVRYKYESCVFYFPVIALVIGLLYLIVDLYNKWIGKK